MARRFQCACGEQEVICSYDVENAKAQADCPSCQKKTLIIDVQQQEADLQVYQCDCGEERVMIDLGIEYPVDAEGGWNSLGLPWRLLVPIVEIGPFCLEMRPHRDGCGVKTLVHNRVASVHACI